MNLRQKENDFSHFTKFEVKVSSVEEFKGHKTLDIVLYRSNNIFSLPYSNTKNLHPLDGFLRTSEVRVVARGEKFTYSQIREMGGFHPHASSSGNYLPGEDPLNVNYHREDSTESGYVATSVSMQVVRSQKTSRTVYLLKGVGMVPPSAYGGKDEVILSEREYSMPGGFDEEDIVAFREVYGTDMINNCYPFGGSPIYIRKSFIENYVNFVPSLIDALLDDHEKCTIPDNLSAMINSTISKSSIENKRIEASLPRMIEEKNAAEELKQTPISSSKSTFFCREDTNAVEEKNQHKSFCCIIS